MGSLVRLVQKSEVDSPELLSVAGYVIRCSNRKVRISYQDPATPDFMKECYYSEVFVNVGDRSFAWDAFTHLEYLSDDRDSRCEEDGVGKKESLVGRVKAGVGSIVLLRASELNVVGYVVDFTPDEIKLGHDDPLARSPLLYTNHLTLGRRWYDLKKFRNWKVLRSREEPQ